ncbi:hypothetical protein BJX99DRAFT_234344 [Aspergillus californicus]
MTNSNANYPPQFIPATYPNFKMPTSGPRFPDHVLTLTFWVLMFLILMRTLASFILKLFKDSCTSWLHPHLDTPLRKTIATTIYTLILAVELHEGFWILKTDWAFWQMMVESPPGVVPYMGNLSAWIDYANGIVACSIPRGYGCGWCDGFALEVDCLRELVALDLSGRKR